MPYALRCADSEMDCPGEFTTKTEAGLMEVIAQVHAPIAHPELDLNDENVAMIKGLVRKLS